MGLNQEIWFPYLPFTYTSAITLGKTYSSYTCLSFSSHKTEMTLPHLIGMRSWSFWCCLLHIFQKTGSYITQLLFHKGNMIVTVSHWEEEKNYCVTNISTGSLLFINFYSNEASVIIFCQSYQQIKSLGYIHLKEYTLYTIKICIFKLLVSLGNISMIFSWNFFF